MSVWRDRARQRIAELVKDLPEDASLSQRRKALWGKGWAAHGGTRWGRKMWGEEVRRYLARHGGETPRKRVGDFDFPNHVHFPFREGAQ